MSGAVLFAQRRRRKNGVTGKKFQKFLPSCLRFNSSKNHQTTPYHPPLPIAKTTREHYVETHQNELEIIINGKPMKKLVVIYVNPSTFTILNLLEQFAINIFLDNSDQSIKLVDEKFKCHIKNFQDITRTHNQNSILSDLGFEVGQTLNITLVKRKKKTRNNNKHVNINIKKNVKIVKEKEDKKEEHTQQKCKK